METPSPYLSPEARIAVVETKMMGVEEKIDELSKQFNRTAIAFWIATAALLANLIAVLATKAIAG